MKPVMRLLRSLGSTSVLLLLSGTAAHAAPAAERVLHEVPATSPYGNLIMIALIMMASTVVLFGGDFWRTYRERLAIGVESVVRSSDRKRSKRKKAARRQKLFRQARRSRTSRQSHGMQTNRRICSSQSKKRHDGPGIRG